MIAWIEDLSWLLHPTCERFCLLLWMFGIHTVVQSWFGHTSTILINKKRYINLPDYAEAQFVRWTFLVTPSFTVKRIPTWSRWIERYKNMICWDVSKIEKGVSEEIRNTQKETISLFSPAVCDDDLAEARTDANAVCNRVSLNIHHMCRGASKWMSLFHKRS